MIAACEMSGRVRDAFAARGWESWSADLLPSETPVEELWTDKRCILGDVRAPRGTHHYQGGVLELFSPYHPVNRERYDANKAEPRSVPLWDLVIAFPPCFTAGTPVITARGVLPIEQVEIGDQVLTHLGRWRTVTARMSREAEVITDGQVTTTPDHPFWTRDKLATRYGPSRPSGGGAALPFELAPAGWVHAAETTGAYLGLPASAEPLPVPGIAGIVKTRTFWYMVGRWLGDGWTRIDGNKHYDTIICCARNEAAELAEQLVETGLRWNSSQERTVTRFTLSNRHLCQWLEDNFGKYAKGKTVPGWLLGAPEDVRESVLRGYLDADGSQSRTRSPGLVSHASTVSRELAVGIRVLATTLGYTTTLTKNHRAGPALIEHRIVQQYDSWSVIIRKDDGRFTRADGLHRWVKQRRPWQDAGMQTVYDITVKEDHSFTAHGFAVHNCTDLSLAGARYWKEKQADGRQAAGAAFFMEMVNAPAPYVAVENPVGIMGRKKNPLYRVPDQVIQPWMFGDPLIKKTCLWLKGLPLLTATHDRGNYESLERVATGGGSHRVDKRNTGRNNNGHEDSLGRKYRTVMRGLTPPGLAAQIAAQWGSFIEKPPAHNHVTRDIKRSGECPGCDYRKAEPPGR